MIALLGVLFDERQADSINKQQINLDALFIVARRHKMLALTAAALEKIGIMNADFQRASAKAKGIDLMFDAEYKRISRALKEEGIAHLPLKGLVIKRLYPAIGLREMSDMDIYFDSAYCLRVREIMESSGYQCKIFSKSNEDVYRKPPLYIVEMHRELFSDDSPAPQLAPYFNKLQILNRPRAELSLEETYIYLISHLYMHYLTSGTGIRSLLDIYVFLKHYRERLDFSCIEHELRLLDMDGFEQKTRELALKFLSLALLSREEIDELNYYIDSGVYGTKNLYYKNRIAESVKGRRFGGKLHYIHGRFTVTPKMIRDDPFYSRHPGLAPLMSVTRPIKALVTKPKKIKYELKVLIKSKSKNK